jgi:hypothetical protein
MTTSGSSPSIQHFNQNFCTQKIRKKQSSELSLRTTRKKPLRNISIILFDDIRREDAIHRARQSSKSTDDNDSKIL